MPGTGLVPGLPAPMIIDRSLADVARVLEPSPWPGALPTSGCARRRSKWASPLGGMVAEELFFGESSTGPGGDLTIATRLAAQIPRAFRPTSGRAQAGISPSPDAGAQRPGSGPGPTLRE